MQINGRTISEDANNLLHKVEPSRAAVEQALVKVWEKTLGQNNIDIDANFFEISGNALLALKTISNINVLFGTHLPLSTLFDHPTIKRLANALVSGEKRSSTSLIPIKPGGNKIPFYFVGYIGGAIDRFCEAAYLLDNEQPVYGLQTHLDLDNFNKESFNIGELASNYIKNSASVYLAEVMKHNPDGPFAIGGYSHGGFIAFEMAKQLQGMGKKVALLALFDTVIPGAKKHLPPKPENLSFKTFSAFHYYRKLLRYKLRIELYDQLFLVKHDRKQWARNNYLLIKNFLPGYRKSRAKNETNTDLQNLVRKRNELAALARKAYPLEYYDVEIVLFRARKPSSFSTNDLTLGWKPYAKSIKVFKVDGDHFSLFRPFYCKRLVKVLQSILDDCSDKLMTSPDTFLNT